MELGDLTPPAREATTPYSVPRGACPFCASLEVEHLLIGMPADPDAFGSGPAWLHWVGCVHPGYSRRCAACEGTWTDVDGLGPAYPDLGALLAHARATSLEELGDWVSEEFELDAWTLVDDEGLKVGFGGYAVLIEFPTGIGGFWDTLEELHDEVCEQLDADSSD